MRVLCIRLANLASLAGEHLVDLEGALGGVGILPITGKTGAGKSTILDAMTLALYRRVARLPPAKSRGVAESDAGLAANDPRTLLREDAGDGFAEVEFIARDGQRYRARWEVRRARGKAGARLQKENWSLVDLASGKSIGHKLAEVGDAIRERVGLDYREFCQAIVLPQGRFAALLRSPAKERAELLESITGTGIYSRISRLAHEHAREARRRMSEVDARIDSAAVLPDGERVSLELRYCALADADKTLRRRLEWEQGRARSLKRLDELRERMAVATYDVEMGKSRLAELAEAGRGLAEATRLGPLRALFATEADAKTRLAVAETVSSSREVDMVAASAECLAAMEELKQAQQAQHALEQELAEVGPELSLARDLDRDLQARNAEWAEVRVARDDALAQVTAKRDQTSELAKASQTAVDVRDLSERWLLDHAGTEGLAQNWAQLAPQLDRLARLDSDIAEIEGTLAATTHKRSDRREASTELQTHVDGAVAETARLQSALAVVLQQLDQLGEATFRSDSEHLESALENARIAKDAWETTAAIAERLETATSRVAKLEGRALGLRHRERESRESETSARAALDVHRRLLHEGRAVASYAEVRSELMDGEPCPLCGASDHPYVTAAPAPLLAHLEGEAKTAQAAHETALTELTAARSAQTACTESLSEARSKHSDLEKSFEMKLGQLRITNGMAEASLVEISDALDAERGRLDGSRTALRARGEAIATARDARVECQWSLDATRSHQEKLFARLSDVRATLAAEDKSVSLLSEQHVAAAKEASELRGLILDALPELEDGFDARSSRVELERRVCEYRANQNSFEQAVKRASAMQHQAELEAARLSSAEALWARENARCSTLECSVTSLQERRSSLLGGRSVQAVEAVLEKRRTSVSAGRERADTRRERADLAATAANARQRDAREALQVSLDAMEGARDAAQNALETAGVQRAVVEHVLASWDEVRMEAVKDELVEARSALAVAEGVHANRLQELREHPPAPFTHAEVEHNVARCLAALESVGSELELASHNRRVDDTRRATVVGLNGERETARSEFASAEALSDLIGSADGALLRTFAQGLTLEVMVGRANAHLQDLAPNLRLRRQGDVDLEVIDSDNANATRSVHSLSGGESFLVSLALALALGSLSGDHVHVESMFIDEGFGSLDADTLDVALAGLESLHAQGRQVVLISHVAGLVERFPVYVQVVQQAPGRSTITTVGAARLLGDRGARPAKRTVSEQWHANT